MKCAFVRACVRACVRAYVRVCVWAGGAGGRCVRGATPYGLDHLSKVQCRGLIIGLQWGNLIIIFRFVLHTQGWVWG